MSRIAIAGLQLDLPKADNLDRIDAAIDQACKRFPWLDMIVLGELAAFGPDPANAQPLPGAAEQRFVAAARRNRLWLVAGSIFESVDDRIFNTASVIDPDGQVVARYRKMFPFFPYEKGITPGSEFVVFDIPRVGRFGLSICYDMWFPETTRTLAWMGAEVILHPTMTNTIDRDVELSIARANAAMNQCYFVDINVAGDLGFGRSGVYGPGGEVIYQARAGREIVAVELDLDTVRRARRRGWHSQVQPLKSFRDSTVAFPAYVQGERQSRYLRSLGPLELPPRPTLRLDET
ncbi:MAG TPA: carbon-nitrogen hydrolase family protein [Steroidobacter sp.]|uniref:carbon-nitrogen hydrolase family protein n=1 Tax=Steroidobacter sp. TaxID=1978227 RepID=UPI002EDAB59B